eukprot:Rhum_TRINITY_DN15289_c6_g2::Rhum_TRINITY_DN15289_c6_g2_i2::g.144445::m.144445
MKPQTSGGKNKANTKEQRDARSRPAYPPPPSSSPLFFFLISSLSGGGGRRLSLITQADFLLPRWRHVLGAPHFSNYSLRSVCQVQLCILFISLRPEGRRLGCRAMIALRAGGCVLAGALPGSRAAAAAAAGSGLPSRQPRRWKARKPQAAAAPAAADACRTVSEATESSEAHVVKHSVFVGHVAPARDAHEAKAIAAELKGGLTHACWGYRGYSFVEKGADDGEPKGTAGEPILRAMTRARLRQAVVVVTREYGGVKLGTGGLYNAYTKAAEMALEEAAYSELPKDPHAR